MHDNAILRAENISVTFHTEKGTFDAVSNVDFSINAGEIFCLVGESGCGKSMTAKALMRLTPENTSLSGKVFLQGQEIFSLSEKEMRTLRGQKIGMIFQEPMTALNPVFRVGEQCTEHVRLYHNKSQAEAKAHCIELFRQVGIPAPETRYNNYPHELSGGMRQRIVIAMALACSPALLLADEPTTALDVTIQWQILTLLQELVQNEQRAIMLITHDLGVVAQMAHKVGVMYAGQIVEYANVNELFANPRHPYTQGLLNASPTKHSMEEKRLPTIDGSVPLLYSVPRGCRFHPRCPQARTECTASVPELKEIVPQHKVRCHLV